MMMTRTQGVQVSVQVSDIAEEYHWKLMGFG